MTTVFLRKYFLLLCCPLVLLASCKKDDTATPKDPNAPPDDIVVLRDGVSFSQDYTLMQTVFRGSSIDVYDFSIDQAKNLLHILYCTKVQGQQGVITNNLHSFYNLDTKVGSVYSGAQIPTVSGQDAHYEFMPYTGKLLAFFNYPFTSGAYQRCIWGGDGIKQLEMPWEASGIGFGYTGGMGYRDTYAGLGWRKQYMCINPDFSASSLAPVTLVNKEYISPAHNNQTLAYFPEPRTGNTLPVIITINTDSVVAYKFTYADSNAGTPALYTKTGQLAAIGYVNSTRYETQRHYNADGNKLAMMVRNEEHTKCWTYTYNHSTQTLASVLSNADLPYSGEGSDIDMDDDGNVYYTGVSGNGAGAGVSVYKRSAAGTTVIGTDDFLKFGTVSKLHYLNGKVHMIVTGSVSGTDFWKQVCYITQK